MILMQALLEINLVEQGSANPFASLVASTEFKLGQLKSSAFNSASKVPLTKQLQNLLAIFNSVSKWNVPEPELRKSLSKAIPVAAEHIQASIKAVNDGNQAAAVAAAERARTELIKQSHLTFD